MDGKEEKTNSKTENSINDTANNSNETNENKNSEINKDNNDKDNLNEQKENNENKVEEKSEQAQEQNEQIEGKEGNKEEKNSEKNEEEPKQEIKQKEEEEQQQNEKKEELQGQEQKEEKKEQQEQKHEENQEDQKQKEEEENNENQNEDDNKNKIEEDEKKNEEEKNNEEKKENKEKNEIEEGKNEEEEKGEEDENKSNEGQNGDAPDIQRPKEENEEEGQQPGQKKEEGEIQEEGIIIDNDEKKSEEDKTEEGDKNNDNDNDENEKNKEENQVKEEKLETPHQRSEYSLEGAKPPLSMYTRRVMDVSKINDYLNPSSAKGKVGGRNLGNTCFMNSSIACLSNCTELTYYFLKGDYLKDINEENTLGMRGELAKEWGNLMKQYWVEDTRVGDPSDFKYTIGRKAERFRGYGQQDSNEFMSVFLDYLNEDLNKTTKKEYVELKEKSDDETDEDCARRFWEVNLRRNDSIVTDLFCGQFKSTITCPNCHWINITFDPFDAINLPLLTQIKRHEYGSSENVEEFKFFYIPKNVLRNPYCCMIKNVSNSEEIGKVIDRIAKEENFIYHDKIDDLLVVDMLRKEKYGFAEKSQIVRQFVYDEEYLFSYDFDKNKDEISLVVYFFKNDTEKRNKSEYPRMIFCKKDDTLEEVRKKIYFYLRKYILSPFLKENEEKDEVSLEIEKYMDDEKLELSDEKLYEMIENEYNKVFTKYETEENEEEKEKNEEEKEKSEEDKEKSEEDKDKENKDSDEEKIGEVEDKDKDEKNKKDGNEEENNKEDEDKKDGNAEGDELKEKNTEDDIKNDNNENKSKEENKAESANNEENNINPTEEKPKENPEEKANISKEEEEKKKEEEKKAKEIEELKNCIEQFKSDIPFEIFIRRERDDNYYHGKTPFINKKNFSTYSKKLKEFLEIENFSEPLSAIQKDMSDYEIIVQFNEDSKYINKKTFDLDYFKQISFEYTIKEKEEEKEEEKKDEEEDLLSGKMTLVKCLKKFCKEEQLTEGDEWYCPKCKKHVLAKKKMDLFYLPKILIICFKRFVKDSYRWEKNEDEVEFPIHNLDMKDFVIGPDKEHSKYDLFAVSQHYGSTGFGHYTAVCLNNDGKWYSYNDSSCSETSESEAQSSAAYVLFYRRQTD